MHDQVVIVLDAKPTPEAEKHIEQCVKANKCLCNCGRKIWKRGLCRICYYDWENDLAELPNKQARAEHNAKLITNGFLLLANWIRKYRRKSAYANATKDLKN